MVPVLAVRDAVHFPLLVNTLHVVREPSLKAVKRSLDGDRTVLVLSQRDMSIEDPSVSDLARIGTLSEALQAIPMPDGGMRLVLRGVRRARAIRLLNRSGSFWAQIEEIDEPEVPDSIEVESMTRAAIETFGKVVQLHKSIPSEAIHAVGHADRAGVVADAIAHHLTIRPAEKQAILEILNGVDRLQKVFELLKREEQILDIGFRINEKVERELGQSQREFYLREQLKAIQSELREREDRQGEADEYRDKIEAAALPPDAREKAFAELKKLDRTPAASPEGMVLRNYLDCLAALPWSSLTPDRIDVKAAGVKLERAHFGLEQVKCRILDTLAVMQLNASLKMPILLFVGPPGVGKTSIARSIAEAMNRKFVRFPLGGLRDEAEIRGHRRTYVGSLPGRLLSGLRACGSRNPVLVLDELDKLGSDFRGDPASALLEALDPEQNHAFVDHYVEIPFDLSSVMFVATANVLEQVPPALRDRMEVIRFPSYTDDERAQIARSFLIPKLVAEHGLGVERLTFHPDAVTSLVRDYTREAGVRMLERQIAAVCRKTARLVAEQVIESLEVQPERLPELIGRPRFRRSAHAQREEVGTSYGLVVGEHGGEVVPIEVCLLESVGPTPELRLTGSLGEVMRESVSAALTAVRASLEASGCESRRQDVHIHIPEAGVPKEGPSAGLTVAIALASAFLSRPLSPNLAATGEITLRGNVLPVGGIRDKVLAAHRAGIRTIMIPRDNLPDLEDVPEAILSEIEIVPVETFAEAKARALG